MADIALPIYKQRRLVPVAFVRAGQGNPTLFHPALDDRGYTGAEHGPIIGVFQGDTVFVRLQRLRLDPGADVYVTSDNPVAASIVYPLGGKLDHGAEADFQIKGLIGGMPQPVKIFARFGSATGPIIGRMLAWVLLPLTLRITPHVAAIASATGAAVSSSIAIADLMDHVRAIWRPCGIEFVVNATVRDAYRFANPGRVAVAELGSLLGHSYARGTINVHLVNCIDVPANPGLLGLGLNRAFVTANRLPRPGIILADTNLNGSNRAADAMWLGNDLAHEIGHFLRLEHPEKKQPPNECKDFWSRRMLMHNFNLQAPSRDWRDQFGYGSSGGDIRRGCMITMKNLAQLTTDGECKTARDTVISPAGPY